ncbi:MAG: hypothetical protein PHW41_03495 [Eubacteriales bacterium]|nr:hypothetical protein [Eubacteriales bacterium]
MSEIRLPLAPFGATILRQSPEFNLERALRRAKMRALGMAALLKRRDNPLEGTMHPDQHNYFASPAQGSTLNAGQFGNLFAQHPCNACDAKHQAYDAETPAHPLRKRKHLLSAIWRKVK